MNKEKFGKRIAELRKALGLNREELAQNLNMSYGHLNNIELGKRMPSVEVIIRLARELQVLSGFLFQQLDDESPFQEFFDTESYVALQYTLSKEDKLEIREYVAFKESRRNSSAHLSFGLENVDIIQD